MPSREIEVTEEENRGSVQMENVTEVQIKTVTFPQERLEHEG